MQISRRAIRMYEDSLSSKKQKFVKEYKAEIDKVMTEFFPKVLWITKLFKYKKYSLLAKAGSLKIMIIEKNLFVKHFNENL